MLTVLKNNRSLTFYQKIQISHESKISAVYSGGLGATAIARMSFQTATTTTGYNVQLQNYLLDLNQKRVLDSNSLDLTIPNSNARNRGVQRAWEYEKANVEMGGKGSADWTKDQQKEILETGKVRGAEGHHQQNVANHPDQQANPDNIKFYKDRETHLKEGHDGDWHKESDAEIIDKNSMLKKTNTERVLKNEIRGLGIALAIGAGIGMTIGFATTLARSGVTPDSIKLALVEGARSGLEAGLLSGVGYGIGRTIGELASKAVEGILQNLGLTITDNIATMIRMGMVGTLVIGAFSIYQFIKLKYHGIATKDALIQVGKQALFSLSLLAVSIVAQGIFGGAAGTIVSVSTGIIIITYSIVNDVHLRLFAEKIRIYTIEKCYPAFNIRW